MVTSAHAHAPATPAWQRLDATWQTLPDTTTGLDAAAQRLLRQGLTEAVGQRLRLLRTLAPESLRLRETRPHLAKYVRERRFYANLLRHYALVEVQRMLRVEAALALEVLETRPSKLGITEWGALLDLQCQRIGQLYAHLRERVGTLALEWLAGALAGLARA